MKGDLWMSEDNLSNIILERLNRMDDRLKNIEQDASTIKTDMTIVKEAVRRLDMRMSSMDSYMSGFHSQLQWQTDEIDALRGRVEKVEDLLPKNDQ